MSAEIKKIQSCLKLFIKERGLNYDKLSKSLHTSPASVKRILNQDDVSLSKIINLCDVLGTDIFELFEISKIKVMPPYKFTLEQEKYLAKNFKALLVFRALIEGETHKKVLKVLSLNQISFQNFLKELEQINLIERHPNSRIKLLAKPPFEWIKRGPLEKAYLAKILETVSHELKTNGLQRDPEQNKFSTPFELLLNKRHQLQFQNELKSLLDKYKSISTHSLKGRGPENIFSGLILTGNFSIWGEHLK